MYNRSLVTNGYSAYLLKEFSSIVIGQGDQALVNGLATSTAPSIAATARSEKLHIAANLSLITNHQTCDDASSLSLGGRNVAAGSDDCQPANVYSKSAFESGADTVTDDGGEDEIDCSGVDDPSGVPPCLVSDGARLSQYCSRSPAQACEDTLATEETTSQSSSTVTSCALTQASPLRGPLHRRESQSLPTSRSSMPQNGKKSTKTMLKQDIARKCGRRPLLYFNQLCITPTSRQPPTAQHRSSPLHRSIHPTNQAYLTLAQYPHSSASTFSSPKQAASPRDAIPPTLY